MMRYLVDTSAYSAFLRNHPTLVEAVRGAEALILNPVVLGELLAGFKAGERFEQNTAWLNRFLASHRTHVLGIDTATADCYAVIQVRLRREGRPIPTNDLWIAASALQHGLTVLTTDPHFERIGQLATELHEA